MPFEGSLPVRLANFRVRNSGTDKHYLNTYPTILDFFKTRVAVRSLARSDAKAAVVLVYTWMARAKLNHACLNNFRRAKVALERIRSEKLDAPAIEDIKSFVGNSLVATSKFLHFMNPGQYAIWDSHVARAAYRYVHHNQYNKTDRYLDYLADLQTLQIDESIRRRARAVLGTRATSLRVKEFVLFHLGISENE